MDHAILSGYNSPLLVQRGRSVSWELRELPLHRGITYVGGCCTTMQTWQVIDTISTAGVGHAYCSWLTAADAAFRQPWVGELVERDPSGTICHCNVSRMLADPD